MNFQRVYFGERGSKKYKEMALRGGQAGSRDRAGTGQGEGDGLFLPLLRRQGFRSGAAAVLSRCCREAPSSGVPPGPVAQSCRRRRSPGVIAVLLGPRAHLPALALQPAHPLLAPLGPHPRSVGSGELKQSKEEGRTIKIGKLTPRNISGQGDHEDALI